MAVHAGAAGDGVRDLGRHRPAEARLHLRLCLARRCRRRAGGDHRRAVAVFELHQPVHAAAAAARPARLNAFVVAKIQAPAARPGLSFWRGFSFGVDENNLRAMTSPEIRAAAAADLPAITEIYDHAVRYGTATFELIPPDLTEMTRRFGVLMDGGFPYLVAALEGRVVGYAS